MIEVGEAGVVDASAELGRGGRPSTVGAFGFKGLDYCLGTYVQFWCEWQRPLFSRQPFFRLRFIAWTDGRFLDAPVARGRPRRTARKSHCCSLRRAICCSGHDLRWSLVLILLLSLEKDTAGSLLMACDVFVEVRMTQISLDEHESTERCGFRFGVVY